MNIDWDRLGDQKYVDEVTKELTPAQCKHLNDNSQDFVMKHHKKYVGGQQNHGGNMWEMGAFQAIRNMMEEVIDQWSYYRQILLCLNQIKDIAMHSITHNDCDNGMAKIIEVLDRVKED